MMEREQEKELVGGSKWYLYQNMRVCVCMYFYIIYTIFYTFSKATLRQSYLGFKFQHFGEGWPDLFT